MKTEFDEKPDSPQITLQAFGERTVIISAPNARQGDKLQFMLVYADGTQSRWVTCDGFYRELILATEGMGVKEIKSRVVSRPHWLLRMFYKIRRSL